VKRLVVMCLLFSAGVGISACSPEVGSVAWCKAMEQKSKLDWTAREFSDYTKHCLNK